jgi:hypothetical protein
MPNNRSPGLRTGQEWVQRSHAIEPVLAARSHPRVVVTRTRRRFEARELRVSFGVADRVAS